MKKIKILDDTNEFFFETRYCVPLEYGGKKLVLLCVENSNCGENSLYHYDESKRHGIGEEYCEDDHDELFEDIIEGGSDLGVSWSCLKKDEEIILEDDEE